MDRQDVASYGDTLRNLLSSQEKVLEEILALVKIATNTANVITGGPQAAEGSGPCREDIPSMPGLIPAANRNLGLSQGIVEKLNVLMEMLNNL